MCNGACAFGIRGLFCLDDSVRSDEVGGLFYPYFGGSDGNDDLDREGGISPDRIIDTE